MHALLAAAILAAPDLVLPEAHFNLANAVRGQRGTCYTVFEGSEIEPFTYEVKGVMKNFLGPKRDVMLVKLLGDKPNFTGVVAGMSGSPCIQDGKLVGALAYAFSVFAKEPIAGITPIDDMLDVSKLPREDLPWRLGAQASTVDAQLRDAADKWLVQRLPAAKGDQALRPIATPLMLGGVPEDVRQQFRPWLEGMGFEPMASGAGAPAGTAPNSLQAGGSVAAIMVRGDVDVAATGTVTMVRDGQVLAFGHPFVGVGAVSFPMATADIVNTMVSSMRSFKMSTTGITVGEVTQDRLTAIGGMLGQKARMIPVSGSVTTPAGTDPYAIEVARDVAMTPRLLAMGLASALGGRVPAGERGTVRVQAEIHMSGEAPVRLRSVLSSERDAGLVGAAGMEAARAFGVLWDNPFGPPADMSLHVDADVTPEPSEESIEGIDIDRPRLRAGHALQVAVRLKRRNGGTAVERFAVQVPRAWVGQQLALVAAGAEAAERLCGDIGGPPRPGSIADIAKYLRGRRHEGHVFLLVLRRGDGLHRGVDTHAFLPGSAVVLQGTGPQRDNIGHGVAWEERRARPGVVSGQAVATFGVSAF